jgi:hypothetical protein
MKNGITLIVLIYSLTGCNWNHSQKEATSLHSCLKDSLYTDLITKVNNDSVYVPVMGFIADSIASDILRFHCLEDESFFNQPLEHLKKIKINHLTLVIADFDVLMGVYYFIINQHNQLVDKVYFTTCRETVINQKVYDWNGDGNDELVEIREYHGQMFVSLTEVVYSLSNDSLHLIFSIETSELNCSTSAGEYRYGSLIQRKYQKKGKGIFIISEIEGRINCDHFYQFYQKNKKPSKITGRKQYEMTTQELLEKFGKTYNK